MGAKKKPFYRVIVVEKRSKRDGKFVEIVGHYNPLAQPAQIVLNHDRVNRAVRVTLLRKGERRERYVTPVERL